MCDDLTAYFSHVIFQPLLFLFRTRRLHSFLLKNDILFFWWWLMFLRSHVKLSSSNMYFLSLVYTSLVFWSISSLMFLVFLLCFHLTATLKINFINSQQRFFYFQNPLEMSKKIFSKIVKLLRWCEKRFISQRTLFFKLHTLGPTLLQSFYLFQITCAKMLKIGVCYSDGSMVGAKSRCAELYSSNLETGNDYWGPNL